MSMSLSLHLALSCYDSEELMIEQSFQLRLNAFNFHFKPFEILPRRLILISTGKKLAEGEVTDSN